MSVYKVILTTIAFVEAEDKEEAKELALDDDAIYTNTSIVSATKSSKKEMVLVMKGGE